MNAKELRERLTLENILTVMETLDAEPIKNDESTYTMRTICHKGEKRKLYLYANDESYSFHCYTECGQLSLFDVVMNHFEWEQSEFHKCIEFICKVCNISLIQTGFGKESNNSTLLDLSFIKDWKRKMKSASRSLIYDLEKPKSYDLSLLNMFQNIYPVEWIELGMTVQTLKKFGVQYSTQYQQVLIPHFDIKGELVGLRIRNIDMETEQRLGKYGPYKLFKRFLNHPLGQHLYGLHIVIPTVLRKKRIMLVEAEKSCLIAYSLYQEESYVVALCGNTLSDVQRNLILMLDLNHVIIALDRGYKVVGSDEYDKWVEKIKRGFVERLKQYVKVSVLLDTGELLSYNDSPFDLGEDVLIQLIDSKITVN